MDAVRLFQHDANRQRFAAGQEVFAQGSPRESMYVVITGEVEIVVDGVVVEVAGPGSLVGEMALIEARGDCELVAVDRDRFLFLVQQTPFFALTVMRVLTERLRRMNAFLGRLVAAQPPPAG